MDCSSSGSSVHGDSPGKNTGVSCHALLQGIFPTQGSNLRLLHCRQILYCPNHQGSPQIHYQFRSVAQLCPTLCNPMNCRMPGFPVHHQLLELTQIHVHLSRWCHPTISSSVVPFSSCLQFFPASGSFLASQFFASILLDWLVWSPCSPGDSQKPSPTPQFKSISSSVFSFLYGPTLNLWSSP